MTPSDPASALRWTNTPTARRYFDAIASLPPPPVTARRHLGRFFDTLRQGKSAAVAFLGGSITWGGNVTELNTDSYRGRVTEWLRRSYPQSAIVSINAGMGGTGSRLGVYRAGAQVVAEKADLCIVEFCVNDNIFNAPEYGDHIDENMEGIVRKCLAAGCDVAVLCVASPNRALPFARHKAVADYYGVPFIELNSHVHHCIDEGLFAYDGDFAEGATNVHPNDFGHSVYAERIAATLAQHAKLPPAAPTPLEAPMTQNRLQCATLAGFTDENVIDWGGWTFEDTSRYGPWLGNISDTKPYEAAWPFPYRWGLAHATQPGQTLRVRFRGRSFGLWGPGGLERGCVQVAVDGAALGEKDFYWPHATEAPMGPAGWEVFAIGLPEGEHEAAIEVTGRKHPESTGHNVSIGFMLVEG